MKYILFLLVVPLFTSCATVFSGGLSKHSKIEIYNTTDRDLTYRLDHHLYSDINEKSFRLYVRRGMKNSNLTVIDRNTEEQAKTTIEKKLNPVSLGNVFLFGWFVDLAYGTVSKPKDRHFSILEIDNNLMITPANSGLNDKRNLALIRPSRAINERREERLADREERRAYRKANPGEGWFINALEITGAVLGTVATAATLIDGGTSAATISSSYSSGTSSSNSSSGSSTNYLQQYQKWEQQVKGNINSLTNASISASNYVLQKRAIRDGQREMQRIRNEALRNGVTIPMSSYETMDVGIE
ncbi:MAG: hypothetical protein LBM20_01330 [Rikenellaceae bacterium]|jgi:hypothetical protein|nr:hypothetical protein [Rikenellaceae bacterium]